MLKLRKLYSVKRDFWNSELKLRFVNPLKGNWYNISGRMHVHSADEYGNWGPRAGGWINLIARHMIWCSLFDPLFPLAHLILASSFARLLRHCNYLISSQKMRIVAYISNWPPKLYHEKGKYRLNRHLKHFAKILITFSILTFLIPEWVLNSELKLNHRLQMSKLFLNVSMNEK